MLRRIVPAAIFTLAIALMSIAIADARGGRDAFAGLDEALKAEIQEQVEALREAGVAHEGMRAAIDALFEEAGVERPQGFRRGPGRRGGNRPQLNLTDGQRAQIHEAISEMKEDGATREDIDAAIDGLFEEFGVGRPERRVRPFRRPGRSLAGLDLTEEEREQIRETVEGMKEDGANRDEIRDAVAVLLEEFGVEADDNPFDGPRPGRRHGRRGGFFIQDLTDEQREQIRQTVEEMKEAGAARGEIREAVKALLGEFGVAVEPKAADGGAGGEAFADLAEIDAQIAAAPAVTVTPEFRMTTWGQLKATR